jgi:hypothetical protein
MCLQIIIFHAIRPVSRAAGQNLLKFRHGVQNKAVIIPMGIFRPRSPASCSVIAENGRAARPIPQKSAGVSRVIDPPIYFAFCVVGSGNDSSARITGARGAVRPLLWLAAVRGSHDWRGRRQTVPEHERQSGHWAEKNLSSPASTEK